MAFHVHVYVTPCQGCRQESNMSLAGKITQIFTAKTLQKHLFQSKEKGATCLKRSCLFKKKSKKKTNHLTILHPFFVDKKNTVTLKTKKNHLTISTPPSPPNHPTTQPPSPPRLKHHMADWEAPEFYQTLTPSPVPGEVVEVSPQCEVSPRGGH